MVLIDYLAKLADFRTFFKICLFHKFTDTTVKVEYNFRKIDENGHVNEYYSVVYKGCGKYNKVKCTVADTIELEYYGGFHLTKRYAMNIFILKDYAVFLRKRNPDEVSVTFWEKKIHDILVKNGYTDVKIAGICKL